MLFLRRIPRSLHFSPLSSSLHTLPQRSRLRLRLQLRLRPLFTTTKPTVTLTPHLQPTSLILRHHATTLSQSSSSNTTTTTPSSSSSSSSCSEEFSVYSAPTTGILSLLPTAVVPYAELIRLDKPTGTLYLLAPCLWSTLLAASLTTPLTAVPPLLHTCVLFTTGALIMRGAGCTINDLWDRRIDPLVARTRLRPLARGAVSPSAAVVFAGAQMLAGLGLLVQFPAEVIVAALPSVAVFTAYPAMKRITHYPQAVLGLAFSWGALLGFPALGLSLLDPAIATAAACLYVSGVCWTLVYDTVYAHQDVADDKKAGVKSTAVAHESGIGAKGFLAALATAQVAMLAGAGVVAGTGPVFFVGSVGGAAIGLGRMIWKVDLKNPRDCGVWFRWCAWAVGGVAVGGGLGGEYVWRRAMARNEVEGEEVEA